MRSTPVVISGDDLRLFMRRVPSPVTVVTTFDGKERRGMTAGSFTSLSLDPPLISFNVTKDSQMHRVLQESSHFAVHVLADTQADLSEHFALPDLTEAEQFDPVTVRLTDVNVPLITGTLGALLCRVHDIIEAGDHDIYVGEVVEIEAAAAGMDPLLYYSQTYRDLGEIVYRPGRAEG